MCEALVRNGFTSPKQKVLIARGRSKRDERTYGSMTHPQQLEICYRYFSNVFYSLMDPGAKAILTWELNSSGDVHLHGLIWDSWLSNDLIYGLTERLY